MILTSLIGPISPQQGNLVSSLFVHTRATKLHLINTIDIAADHHLCKTNMGQAVLHLSNHPILVTASVGTGTLEVLLQFTNAPIGSLARMDR